MTRKQIIEYLEWDSTFFGFRVSKLSLKNCNVEELKIILKHSINKQNKLTYCFVSPEDEISNNSIIRLGGTLVDIKVNFRLKITKNLILKAENEISPYKQQYPSNKLISLAIQSGVYSRFNIDSRFKNNEFEKLYKTWIEKSVSKNIAKEVLVYTENKNNLGFVTLDIVGNEGVIGLIAVDEKARGKSIGKKLINSALLTFMEWGLEKVTVATQQENKVACNFYKACGFKTQKTTNIYHIWN